MIFFVASCGQNKKNSQSSLPKPAIFQPMNITMKNGTLSSSDDPIVLRTDFSDDQKWETICLEIMTPEPNDGFIPYVSFVNDTSFQGFPEKDLLEKEHQYNHAFIFIIDELTISNPEHPILCVGLEHNKGLKLRTISSEMWAIENNLSICNMDFEDFIGCLDNDGVYRGFK